MGLRLLCAACLGNLGEVFEFDESRTIQARPVVLSRRSETSVEKRGEKHLPQSSPSVFRVQG